MSETERKPRRARKKKGAPLEPEVLPPEPFWRSDPRIVWFLQELTVAALVGGTLTAMLLVHRWAGRLLGQGLLNEQLFAGNSNINDLVARVDLLVRGGAAYAEHASSATEAVDGADTVGATTTGGTGNAHRPPD